jgi:hypothetical protein
MENAHRVEEDYKTATKNGFKLQNTLYAMGTPINATGISNLRKSREEYDSLSTSQEEANKVIKIVKEEERSDDKVLLSSYRMNKEGNLFLTNLESSGYTNYIPTTSSLNQLVRRTSSTEAVSAAANYVSDVDSPIHLRTTVCNYYLETSNNTAIFRSRKYKDRQRELYATVSERFSTECDVDELCRIISEQEYAAKSMSFYDGTRFRFDIIYHTDIKPEDGVCGELFKAGVTVRSSDNGLSGIRISPFVIRNLCLNLIILDHAEQHNYMTHLRKNLKETVVEAIQKSLTKVQTFKEKWSSANKIKVLENTKEETVKAYFENLIKNGPLKNKGITKESITNFYNNWTKEPGDKLSSVVNAITRSAHEDSMTIWKTTLLEEQAGTLLYINT